MKTQQAIKEALEKLKRSRTMEAHRERASREFKGGRRKGD